MKIYEICFGILRPVPRKSSDFPGPGVNLASHHPHPKGCLWRMVLFLLLWVSLPYREFQTGISFSNIQRYSSFNIYSMKHSYLSSKFYPTSFPTVSQSILNNSPQPEPPLQFRDNGFIAQSMAKDPTRGALVEPGKSHVSEAFNIPGLAMIFFLKFGRWSTSWNFFPESGGVP